MCSGAFLSRMEKVMFGVRAEWPLNTAPSHTGYRHRGGSPSWERGRVPGLRGASSSGEALAVSTCPGNTVCYGGQGAAGAPRLTQSTVAHVGVTFGEEVVLPSSLILLASDSTLVIYYEKLYLFWWDI